MLSKSDLIKSPKIHKIIRNNSTNRKRVISPKIMLKKISVANVKMDNKEIT